MVDLLVIVVTVLAVLVGAALIFVALNRLLDQAPIVWQDRIRPWVFIFPALVFLGVGLIWPTLRTVYLSFRAGRDGEDGFTFDNFQSVFTDPRHFSFNNFGDIFTSRLFILAAILVFVAIAYMVVMRQRSPGTGVDIRAPVPSLAVVAAAILLSIPFVRKIDPRATAEQTA